MAKLPWYIKFKEIYKNDKGIWIQKCQIAWWYIGLSLFFIKIKSYIRFFYRKQYTAIQFGRFLLKYCESVNDDEGLLIWKYKGEFKDTWELYEEFKQNPYAQCTMGKYYYTWKINDEGWSYKCLERCRITNKGIMVGSISCKKCDFNQGYNNEEKWIKCSKLKEAIG